MAGSGASELPLGSDIANSFEECVDGDCEEMRRERLRSIHFCMSNLITSRTATGGVGGHIN